MKKVLLIIAVVLGVTACQKDFYLDDLNAANDQIAQFESIVAAHGEANASLTAEISSLTTEIASLTASLTEAEGLNADLVAQAVVLNDEIVDLNQKITDGEGNLAALEVEFAEAVADYTITVDGLKGDVGALSDEITSLEVQVGEANDLIDVLSADRAELLAAVVAGAEALEIANQQVADLSAALESAGSSIEDAIQAIEKLQASGAVKDALIADLEDDVADLNDDVADLTGQIAALNASSELDETAIANLQSLLDVANLEIAALNDRIAELDPYEPDSWAYDAWENNGDPYFAILTDGVWVPGAESTTTTATVDVVTEVAPSTSLTTTQTFFIETTTVYASLVQDQSRTATLTVNGLEDEVAPEAVLTQTTVITPGHVDVSRGDIQTIQVDNPDYVEMYTLSVDIPSTTASETFLASVSKINSPKIVEDTDEDFTVDLPSGTYVLRVTRYDIESDGTLTIGEFINYDVSIHNTALDLVVEFDGSAYTVN